MLAFAYDGLIIIIMDRYATPMGEGEGVCVNMLEALSSVRMCFFLFSLSCAWCVHLHEGMFARMQTFKWVCMCMCGCVRRGLEADPGNGSPITLPS